jgi:signal transduction histidine kinase
MPLRYEELGSQITNAVLENMGHELLTPMNGVLGMVELLLDTQLTAEQRNYILVVKSSAESLTNVIRDLLSLAKMESSELALNPVAFDLHGCIAALSGAMDVRAQEKGLRLRSQICDRVPRAVVGDRELLGAIVSKLLHNAIKFTEQGEVVLDVSVLGQADNSVEMQFTVIDTGIGISPEKRSVIFRPFAQADSSSTRKYGGAGLGLAICSRLADMMGGKITVDSNVGKGSSFCFRVRLPLTSALVASQSTNVIPCPLNQFKST